MHDPSTLAVVFACLKQRHFGCSGIKRRALAAEPVLLRVICLCTCLPSAGTVLPQRGRGTFVSAISVRDAKCPQKVLTQLVFSDMFLHKLGIASVAPSSGCAM